MHIPFDRQSGAPLHLQIQRHFERLILRGSLPHGHKLPASRELARDLKVNRGTVTRAYEGLETEGLVHSHIGQGTFVRRPGGLKPEEPPAVEAGAHRTKVWQGAFARRVARMENREAAAFRSALVSEETVSFASGIPESALFPAAEFGRAVNAALREHGGEVLEYGPTQGYYPLRQWVSARLTEFGIEAVPEEVTIVSGSQQAIDLIARLLIDPEDKVLVEAPTYSGALNAFHAFQAEYLTVHRGWDGLDLDALENILSQEKPKFFYVIPCFHYPTGHCLGRRAMRELMDLLERYQVPFVEDDFCAHLRYEGETDPALKSMDRSGLGIYIGTFSKSLFPGLRIGWVVAPREVTERLVDAKQASDLRSGVLVQAAAYEFCRRGGFDRQIRRVREVYRERRDAALEALARHFPEGCEWHTPRGGLSVWVTLPGDLDATEILAETSSEGVLFAPGALFSPFRGTGNAMRLCFAALDPGRIEKGMAVIGKAVRKRVGPARRPGPPSARDSLALP